MASETNPSTRCGKILAHPKPGEEVVISGLAGRYPNSKTLSKFQDNLFNKQDMITADNRRWQPGHPEIPHRTGKVGDIEKFDAGFFGIHNRQGHSLDPMARMFMETVIQAIFDAGLHPSDFEGTATGVFVGVCFCESEKWWFHDSVKSDTFAMTGAETSVIANRVSYFLKLKGPSVICDTACSSSLYALDHAYIAIRTGICDAAIVGGVNLCLHPNVSHQFSQLGVLCMDGFCKVFDNAGNGYVRSETICAIILQKSRDAKRIYATVVHSKTNCDGYTDSGINYPSGEMQAKLFKDFYDECDVINRFELSFMEAHGTGTKVGDPEELSAIEKVFLGERKSPLLIGSIKSNIGHTEPASGICAITKAIIAFESGYIAPNLHYSTPREGIKCLVDGTIKVVTEKTPLEDEKGLIGINSFGFGGANCHVLLKRNPNKKYLTNKTNIPRLITVSGRTPEAVNILLDNVIQNKLDVGQIRLIQNAFRKTVQSHCYRGYSLVSQAKEIYRSCSYFNFKPVSLIICFGIIDNVSMEKIKEFLEVPTFSETIKKTHEILTEKNVNVMDILLSNGAKTATEMILLNAAIQMALADLLKALEIKADKIFGINGNQIVDILVCRYVDGTLGLKEAVELIYDISLISNEVTHLPITHQYNQNDNNVVPTFMTILEKIVSKSKKLTETIIVGDIPNKTNANCILNSYHYQKVLKQVKEELKKGHILLKIGNEDSWVGLELNDKEKVSILSNQIDLSSLMVTIGRLYELGLNPQLQHFYPNVDLPVSRGTPMISPAIEWKHDKDWHVTAYTYNEHKGTDEKPYSICLGNHDYEYIAGHVIDGRNLFPATGYLYLVWDLFAAINQLFIIDMKVIFENCRFIRACTMPANALTKINLHVKIQRETGHFEISEGNSTVVTGRIRLAVGDEANLTALEKAEPKNEDSIYMTKNDIYKELKLRGYNYSKQFRATEICDVKAQYGVISWNENWVCFMDNMLQMKVLQEDSRQLYVPTTIGKLTIDAKKHLDVCQSLGEIPNVPVNICKRSNIIQSGGIEIRNLIASSIARKKNMAIPVLEKHVFVPNIAKLSVDVAIRVNTQFLIENLNSVNVKVIELIDEATPDGNKVLGDIVYDALADQPLIQPNITVLSQTAVEVRNINVEDRRLHTEVDCHLVIASKLIERSKMLNLALRSIQQSGFILSREVHSLALSTLESSDVHVVTVYNTGEEQLVFLKKVVPYIPPVVVKVSSQDTNFTWLPKLQDALDVNDNIVLYVQGDILNGFMGLLTCLRKEPGGRNAKLVCVADSAPEFDIQSPFYVDQLKKQIPLNVYKNGQWGTYKHLLINENIEVEREHCYLNTTVRGDLSSLRWIEGPLASRRIEKLRSNKINVKVYYGALNFRDVMTALGKITVDAITRDRREQECIQGFEFSGRTERGRRVFGMLTAGACASMVNVDESWLLDIPNNWSMKEAATVAVVYATSIYGLIMIANIQPGNSVLIHSGTGGVGQAAIAIALSRKCTVYTTVGTQEKREFLRKIYPEIPDNHIFHSRDTSFEGCVMRATKGRGVDVVLNSLAEEKLVASVRCLAHGGKFLEIGKFDISQNNSLNLFLLKKNCSFYGIMLDWLLKQDVSRFIAILTYLKNYMKHNYIRPLNYTLFRMNQAEEAYRFMTTGKHTGKVLLEIRKEEDKKFLKPSLIMYPCVPRYHCNGEKSYIICGGLGGFGLELADWLIMRGCKKIILTSRSGIKTGYQAYRISIWKSYGYTIRVYTDDITTEAGCLSLIQKANKLGSVHAIFNLAVVLENSILTNQTPFMFKTTFAPKAKAAQYLDLVTRKYCPELRDFVMFSSYSCGRGNAGQSNYGMANSIMERICEKRNNEGLPGLAIQWGAIGDVGIVADMQDDSSEIEIGGTKQQKITNCLEVLDRFLNQNKHAVVASSVVAEKKSEIGMSGNIINDVAAILGIKDLKTIFSQSTLAEAGMDSMSAVEIKQTLEREYEIFLTPQEMKYMTFVRLQELQDNKGLTTEVKQVNELNDIAVMIGRIKDEATADIVIIRGISSERSSLGNIILFPGLEGVLEPLKPLYQHLEGNILGIQFCNYNQKDTIDEMAEVYLKRVEEKLIKTIPFKIVCYSFGGNVALETARKLEKKGYTGTVICIDTSPDYSKAFMTFLQTESDDKIQVSLLIHILGSLTSQNMHEITEKLTKASNFEERLDLAEQILKSENEMNIFNIRSMTTGICKRVKAVLAWKPNFKLKSKLLLFKAKQKAINMPDADYGLEKFSEQSVIVQEINGNHLSMLEDSVLAEKINEIP